MRPVLQRRRSVKALLFLVMQRCATEYFLRLDKKGQEYFGIPVGRLFQIYNVQALGVRKGHTACFGNMRNAVTNYFGHATKCHKSWKGGEEGSSR
jgi:hypothetical protein